VIDGTVVVNWNAAIAELFFLGRESIDTLANSITGRRSFHVSSDDITEYFDELEVNESPLKIFPLTFDKPLDIPAPPKKARPILSAMNSIFSTVSGGSKDPGIDAPDGFLPKINETSVEKIEEALTPTLVQVEPINTQTNFPEVRSLDAVVHALNQPRRGRLNAVLSTLQPDQYKLVTWPSNKSLIVQGQPGTGKTIIALHRAAFLTHPESEFKDQNSGPLQLRKIALIGPTDLYADHVKHVQTELGSSGIQFLGVDSLLRNIIGLKNEAKDLPASSLEYFETRWELGGIAEKAVRWWLRNQPGRAIVPEHVFDALTKDSPLRTSVLESSSEFEELLNEMGNWKYAAQFRNYWPFMAMITLSSKKISIDQQFDHIFVDEAQDIDPLRWRIIDKYLKPGATYSIFGDMNQRRSNFTYNSWGELAMDLQITDDEGTPPVRELKTIYRSTRQILMFASRLLPKTERRIFALREGLPPRVVKVSTEQINQETVKQMALLAEQFPNAINAVIGLSHIKIRDEFRKNGWIVDTRENKLTKETSQIRVLRPEEARGLEFDAVVVVEPSDFPENVGRQGVLYTSLTRANQELVIVHSKKLPQPLQNRSDRR
jgi:DNA helicase-2/ATP-dependent DNA helicase PcrA